MGDGERNAARSRRPSATPPRPGAPRALLPLACRQPSRRRAVGLRAPRRHGARPVGRHRVDRTPRDRRRHAGVVGRSEPVCPAGRARVPFGPGGGSGGRGVRPAGGLPPRGRAAPSAHRGAVRHPLQRMPPAGRRRAIRMAARWGRTRPQDLPLRELRPVGRRPRGARGTGRGDRPRQAGDRAADPRGARRQATHRPMSRTICLRRRWASPRVPRSATTPRHRSGRAAALRLRPRRAPTRRPVPRSRARDMRRRFTPNPAPPTTAVDMRRGLHYQQLRDRFPVLDGRSELLDELLELYTPRNLYALQTIANKIEAEFRDQPLAAIFRLALAACLLPASRLNGYPGRVASLRISGGHVRQPASRHQREVNVWRLFESAVADVRTAIAALGRERRPARFAADLEELGGVGAANVLWIRSRPAVIGQYLPPDGVDMVLGSLAAPPSVDELSFEYLATAWLLGREAAETLRLEPTLRHRTGPQRRRRSDRTPSRGGLCRRRAQAGRLVHDHHRRRGPRSSCCQLPPPEPPPGSSSSMSSTASRGGPAMDCSFTSASPRRRIACGARCRRSRCAWEPRTGTSPTRSWRRRSSARRWPSSGSEGAGRRHPADSRARPRAAADRAPSTRGAGEERRRRASEAGRARDAHRRRRADPAREPSPRGARARRPSVPREARRRGSPALVAAGAGAGRGAARRSGGVGHLLGAVHRGPARRGARSCSASTRSSPASSRRTRSWCAPAWGHTPRSASTGGSARSTSSRGGSMIMRA